MTNAFPFVRDCAIVQMIRRFCTGLTSLKGLSSRTDSCWAHCLFPLWENFAPLLRVHFPNALPIVRGRSSKLSAAQGKDAAGAVDELRGQFLEEESCLRKSTRCVFGKSSIVALAQFRIIRRRRRVL